MDQSSDVTFFNGATWSAPQKPVGLKADAYALSCGSATLCVASDIDGHVATFNGTTWSKAVGIFDYGSLSCVSSNWCLMSVYTDFQTFDGTHWSTPQTGPAVDGVSCSSSEFCVAADDLGQAFVYNGSTWSGPTEVTSPLEPIFSLSCPSVGFCAALAGNNNVLGGASP